MRWTAALTPNLLWVLVATFCALAAGSLVRLAAVRRSDSRTAAKRLESLRTWWVLVIATAAAVLLGRLGVCLLMALASGLAMREYVQLVAVRSADCWGIRLVYLAIPIHYGLVFFDWHTGVLVFTPLVMLLVLAAAQVLQGDTEGYVRATAGMFWGAMVLVYGLSHAALLMTLPSSANPGAGAGGWFLYLVLLTETNDIAQALFGRRFGAHKRHRITPHVSPNKTGEGFLGGMLVTILLAVVLAPLLTPWSTPVEGSQGEWHIPGLWPAVAGALIAISGFCGDINMSAVKRDASIKDSSSLLPGMGGMIDRIDSLTFAAPVFYYFVRWLA